MNDCGLKPAASEEANSSGGSCNRVRSSAASKQQLPRTRSHSVMMLDVITVRNPNDWDKILAKLSARAKNFKSKKEHIDHDLIAHGVNRNGDVLLPNGTVRRKR